MSLQNFGAGAAQAAGKDLADKVLQTPQGQQALQATATGIATSGAAAVGTALAAGHVASAATTAAVATGIALVAAAPLAAAGVGIVGVMYAGEKLWSWLNK